MRTKDMDNRTERLADGVWRVEVGPFVNAFVLANDGEGDGNGLTVVDTGLRHSGPRLIASIRALGLDPVATRDVLLTHWHPDHAGSALRFLSSSAAPTVWASAEDRDVITGAQPPRAQISEDTGPSARLYHKLVRPPVPVPDVAVLEDGAIRAVSGGLRVVATPGHTAGHLSFHLEAHGIVLAGDALFNVLFPSRGPRMVTARRGLMGPSLARLAELAPRTVAPGHGPPLERDPVSTLHRLGRAP